MKRAYIDANVILRFLTGDPREMADLALLLFESVDKGEQTLVINGIVIAEVVWVLQSFYGYSPKEISKVVQEFISHEGLEIQEKIALITALNLYAEKDIDFIDAVVVVNMIEQGINEIYSFDHHFDRLSGIVRLAPGG